MQPDQAALLDLKDFCLNEGDFQDLYNILLNGEKIFKEEGDNSLESQGGAQLLLLFDLQGG